MFALSRPSPKGVGGMSMRVNGPPYVPEIIKPESKWTLFTNSAAQGTSGPYVMPSDGLLLVDTLPGSSRVGVLLGGHVVLLVNGNVGHTAQAIPVAKGQEATVTIDYANATAMTLSHLAYR
jgi:hypothetical protein